MEVGWWGSYRMEVGWWGSYREVGWWSADGGRVVGKL